MGKLNSFMQLMIYTNYWQLFFNNDNCKYTTTSQRRSSIFCLVFLRFFYLIVFFFIVSFQTFMHEKTSRLCSILHIVYFEFLLHNVLHSVGNMYWWMLLRWLFYFCSNVQILSDVANKSVIPYGLIKTAPETQNL